MPDWNPLGPSFEINEPANIGTKNTGRVTWIETTTNFDGQGTPAIYLATAGGGVWRSSDFTSSSPTWVPLTDHLPLPPVNRDGIQDIASLAVDPNHPQTIYAGTGDPLGGAGQGILKSTDGGSTWTLLGQTRFAYQAGVSRIIVDPTPAGSPSNPTGNTVYAVGRSPFPSVTAGSGAWKSVDGGVTWNPISSGIAPSAIAVQDLEYTLDGTGTNLTLYMAVRDASGSNPQVNGFYSSLDGGTSWEPMSISPLSDMFTGQPVPPSRMGPMNLASLRTAGAPPQVCATVGDAVLDSQLGGHRLLNVFRFGGGFWIPIGNTMSSGVGNNKILNQDGYDQPIGVSNSGAIYVGVTQPFYQSVDGGATWEDVEFGTNGIKPHTDFHAIAFFRSAVYVGTDGGPYRFNPLPNFQLGRSTWDDLNSSLQTHLVLGVGVHATNPTKILIAQPDNSTALRNPDGSFSWVRGGDTQVAKFDPHPEHADYAYTIEDGGIQRSSDAGRTWVGLPFPGSQPPGAWDLDFYPTISPDPSRIVAATNPVFETRDSRAASVVWTQRSPSEPNLLAGGSPLIKIAYASPDTIYAAFGNNHIYKTTDDGVTWPRIDQDVIPGGGGNIQGLVTNPFHPLDLCVASTLIPATSGPVGTIFRTTDGGQRWVNLTGNLPGVRIRSIALLPISTSEDPWLFVGTSVGVYVATSLQGNVQWARVSGSGPGSDLPDGEVASLYINPATKLLVAGIRGRGVWGTTILPHTMWHTIRHADGSWQPLFDDVERQVPPPGIFDAVNCASIGSDLHVCGITEGGGMWHTIRHADGSWQPFFGDVKGQTSDPGPFSAVACAGINGELHLCGVTTNGGMWHTIRHADGSWQPFFGDVKRQTSNPGVFRAVGCAGINGELHLCGVTDDGGMWHTIRHADGSWQPFFGDVKRQTSDPGPFSAVSCAGVNGELHLCGVITLNGGMWHTIRHADGSWQPFFGDVKSQSGDPGPFSAVGCAEVNGELQVCGVIVTNGGLWHTIRHADGSWQPFFGDVKSQSGDPGSVIRVGCAGIGGELHISAVTLA